MKKSGFTLAEVLITLVIIGVIAAMTIPTLLSNTNKQEFKTALKKAMSVINQAITLNYALTGNEMNSVLNDTNLRNEFMYSRTSILKVVNDKYYTADGIIYDFTSAKGACAEPAAGDPIENFSGANCTLIVDVNGDKGPNVKAGGAAGGQDDPITNVEGIKDQYVFYVLPQRVIPGKAAQSVLSDSASMNTSTVIPNTPSTP